MDVILQQKLKEDPKMDTLLKQNSYWFKDLNRNGDAYSKFVTAMKEKYHLKMTDRLNDAIDNISIISGILETLK